MSPKRSTNGGRNNETYFNSRVRFRPLRVARLELCGGSDKQYYFITVQFLEYIQAVFGGDRVILILCILVLPLVVLAELIKK